MSVVGVLPRRDIVDVVLGVQRPRHRRHSVVAVGVGVAVCALLGLSALRLGPRRGARSEVVAAATRVPVEISLAEAVAPLAPPAAARSPSVPAPAPAPTPLRPAAARAPRRAEARAASPPAAQASTVVAREPAPSAPVDLTGETFVMGSAKTYAGGVTAAEGTSTVPGQGRASFAGGAFAGAASGDGAAATSTSTSRASPVFLASASWSCPWPHEAEPLPLDEQTVIIRVVVRPDGMAESVAVVADPGHGFGEAAATCAMRTPFVPARATGGEPVRATSAPIRLRFIR